LLRDLACAALVLAAGAVLWLGIGLAYALAAEYGSAASGDSVGSGLRNAVLGGLLIGLLTWALVWPAIHLIARRPLAGRHPAVTLGVIVLVAIVGVAVAGWIGTRDFGQGQARERTACTATRVAAFVELGLPYTISAPMGNRDGTCADTFVVPGTPTQVDARIDARLRALGWARATPDPGVARHYRRGDPRLTARDDGAIADSGYIMVTMTIS